MTVLSRSASPSDLEAAGALNNARKRVYRWFLQDGNRPDRDGIRTEEFINYFAQDYVSQHHGAIEFDSEPGRTCFTVLLPLP